MQTLHPALARGESEQVVVILNDAQAPDLCEPDEFPQMGGAGPILRPGLPALRDAELQVIGTRRGELWPIAISDPGMQLCHTSWLKRSILKSANCKHKTTTVQTMKQDPQ